MQVTRNSCNHGLLFVDCYQRYQRFVYNQCNITGYIIRGTIKITAGNWQTATD